ncbi:MAG: zinc metallopeptidase [Fibrobacter sp.]|jgi:Zn-dependent membrane protease YugP|nr:zinc metallopeptidase [Fibrobacter sp.]
MDPVYLLIVVFGLLISGVASFLVKSRFKTGQKVVISSGLTGAEVAAAILADANITDVQILETQGFLGDYYNPLNKTLNLSREVYHGRNASAAGVAAHEVGHALQHAGNYFPMWLRSFIVPVAGVGGNLGPWIVIAGIILMSLSAAYGNIGYQIAVFGVALFGVATLFSFVTVPVEFNASSRAKKRLAHLNIVRPGKESEAVAGVLLAAGLTYVAAAITSFLQLVYWAWRAGLLGNRR